MPKYLPDYNVFISQNRRPVAGNWKYINNNGYLHSFCSVYGLPNYIEFAEFYLIGDDTAEDCIRMLNNFCISYNQPFPECIVTIEDPAKRASVEALIALYKRQQNASA